MEILTNNGKYSQPTLSNYSIGLLKFQEVMQINVANNFTYQGFFKY